MSKFLDELQELADAGFHEDACDKLINIGENAKRGLEIGILQDMLVGLGFEKSYYGLFSYYPQPKTCMEMQRVIEVYFDTAWIVTIKTNDGGEWHYHSPTWQQDVLAKVKELIND